MKQVTIKNDRLALETLSYGAIIHKLKLRIKDSWKNLNFSLDSPEAYRNDPFAIGACVGRYAGRLSGGFLQIEGENYPLPNENGVTLHGGKQGFSKREWDFISQEETAETSKVTLRYKSAHLEEGFPGNLEVTVAYILEGNTLIIRHEAATDRPTVVNLTNHTYFKIDTQPLVSHYRLWLDAGMRAETDSRLLPTGRLLEVGRSDYNFQTERTLGDMGFDTPFVLNPNTKEAARLTSPISNIQLSLETNQPSIILYTPSNFAGVCLETQNLPDAPRFNHFPNSILHPGERYVNESHFTFESIV